MLDNILNLVKNTVSGFVSNNNSIPENEKNTTSETITHAIGEGLKHSFNIDNLSGLTNLFENGAISNDNPIVNNIITMVKNALSQQTNLSQDTVNNTANKIIPMVIKAISEKINNPNEKEFNIQSIINSFSKNNSGSNTIINTLGKLFDK